VNLFTGSWPDSVAFLMDCAISFKEIVVVYVFTVREWMRKGKCDARSEESW
jgi:hypothetical protein